jgi:hypothetical protein
MGTPFIRFNDFVGRLGYLSELEDKYQLGFGIKPEQEKILYDKLRELLEINDLKPLFAERRRKMLTDKIDVSKFLTWFIENYPESSKTMKDNPDYQFNFS